MQLIAAGAIPDIRAAREIIGRSFEVKTFRPSQLLPAYILGIRPSIGFTLNARAGLLYTIYVIGNWSRPRVKIVVNQPDPARWRYAQ